MSEERAAFGWRYRNGVVKGKIVFVFYIEHDRLGNSWSVEDRSILNFTIFSTKYPVPSHLITI